MPVTVRLRNRILYLSSVFILSMQLCFPANAQGNADVPDKRISLSARNTSLGFILKKVSKISGIIIFFSTEELAPFTNVSVNARDRLFSDIMHELLDNRGLSYVVVNSKTITITRKTPLHVPASTTSDTTISVSGKVINEKGLPVIAASVAITGTSKGTTTDQDGTFVINGVSRSASLTISSVSFLTQQIQIRGRSNLGVIPLKEYVSDLDETVVKGYYNTTKRLNTGTVITLKGREINQQPVSNPLIAMMGRVPNLVITPTSGLPNGAVNIQLRGQNSLSTGSFRSEPLIIVDGVPYPNTLKAGSGSFGLVRSQLSALSFVNVNDIEQIDVLSDADATSIYGSRGGNGVILITTKKGKVGATSINISLSTGISQVSKKLDLLNTSQYLQMRREAYASNGIIAPDKQTQDKNYSNYDLTVWDQNGYTDWQKEFLGRTAMSYNGNVSVSGGSSTVQYLVGGNFSTQKYVFPGDNKFENGTANFSISGNSENGRFKSLLSGSYTFNTSFSNSSDFTTLAVTLAPNAPAIYTKNGTLNWEPDPTATNKTGTWQNPYAQLLQTSLSKNNNLRGNTEFSYKISENISARVSAGYSEIRTRNLGITPIASFDPADTTARGASSLTSLLNKSFTFDPQINYSGQIGEGKLDGLIGVTIQNQGQENETISGTGYTSDALLKSFVVAPSTYSTNNTSEYRYAAIFARLSYNWQNKYLVNLTGRRDGSSRFGPGYQFGNFWSTGLAWIFTEEEPVKTKLPFLSYGKLRFSIGTNGNDGIGDYQYLELYQGLPNVTYQGIRPIRSLGVANPDYHWEKVRKLELSLETGFFNDRLLFTTSFWRTRASDQLGTYRLPSTGGAVIIIANQHAEIQNSGWDFILNSRNISTKNFTWSTSANFGLQYNKLLANPDGLYNGYGLNRFVTVGQPFTGFAIAYISKGVNPATGLYQFVDADGNVNTDKDNGNTQGMKINTKPLTIGLSNTLSFKGFDLSFFLQFTHQAGRNYLFDYTFISRNPGSFYSEPGQEYGNIPVELLNNWKKPGNIAAYQKFSSENYSEPNTLLLDKARESDLGWVDASFLRLRNVAFSYSVPTHLISKYHLQNFKVYIQGQNLLTITNYKGLDPETQSASSLPLLRVLTAGIQIGL
ncbi:SusC/RagA family TonB-linked outer membrane protein [Chitinophaga filiformis]|uniref:TonB-linked outer membrane protein, SusC/RagA family n=1 Tax=Chitinophaga filiformis TaxID=104663 RepID=A0A1G7R2P9_CHIFI|nr:SusC/RagA family TonB-linked outer membrane protein [Chitinophaga filiformis]SDG05008.1 TonB-linked outer membrane protein, SusC/RagA family [Chitinophaga filiformis]